MRVQPTFGPLGFQILFVVYYRWAAFGAILGAMCSLGVLAIWCLPWFLKQLFRPFSRDFARAMLKFSLPLLPGAIAIWVINSSSAYFILWGTGGDIGFVRLHPVCGKRADQIHHLVAVEDDPQVP